MAQGYSGTGVHHEFENRNEEVQVSGSYKQTDVKCPFYKHDDGKKRVTCEGLIDDSSIALIYRNKSDFVAQISAFCCIRYKNCEIYRLLMDKYDEEE